MAANQDFLLFHPLVGHGKEPFCLFKSSARVSHELIQAYQVTTFEIGGISFNSVCSTISICCSKGERVNCKQSSYKFGLATDIAELP